MEWHGFNNKLARTEVPSRQKPANTYLVGPLIDSPPHHPDTVLTSLRYIQKSLVDMGMTYVHLSIDIQLYMVSQQIKWNDRQAFQNIILRPGAMHVIPSFCGCIGKLHEGGGLDVLVAAAFGSVAGILEGKSWVCAMRAFRMVTSVLLQRFHSSTRVNTPPLVIG